MSKLKVGFEITDNWHRGDFREFIQKLIKDDCNYEVYLISNDDISSYIYSIGESLRLPNDHVIVVNFTQDKLQKIVDLELDIYLDNLKYVADQIENTTDTYGIYVDELPNKYYLEPKYVIQFNNVLKLIRREDCAEAKEE